MRLPAIRAEIGIWTYYVSSMSFLDISIHVKEINDELHKSTTLSEMIQRSISDNNKIKNYILNQNERFFNSLVLAVYDGQPEWIEVELSYNDGEEFFNIGFLQLNGEEKIFPVDGQHRVAGIKKALKENKDLAEQKIPVIFIGHRTDEEGMKRTRRLFSTLNRYAKPVSMRDIIALDEDDLVAIATRELLVNHTLFKNDRVLDSKGKPIPENNKNAFTSVITLYDCNMELLKYHKSVFGIKKSISEYLKFRPSDEEIDFFSTFLFDFWSLFENNIDVIKKFISSNNNAPAEQYRNRESGGHLLFRPIGLLPFITATLEIKKRVNNLAFRDILSAFNNKELSINKEPWIKFLWNDIEKKIIAGDNKLVKLLLLYMYNASLLRNNELDGLKAKYKGKLGDPAEADKILNRIKQNK